MKAQFNQFMGEVLGALVGVAAVSYGVFILVTNSLETIF